MSGNISTLLSRNGSLNKIRACYAIHLLTAWILGVQGPEHNWLWGESCVTCCCILETVASAFLLRRQVCSSVIVSISPVDSRSKFNPVSSVLNLFLPICLHVTTTSGKTAFSGKRQVTGQGRQSWSRALPNVSITRRQHHELKCPLPISGRIFLSC